MAEQELKIGPDYEYKGKRYMVLESVSMKDPNSGLWLDAVAYTPTPKGPEFKMGPTYIRYRADFDIKFDLV